MHISTRLILGGSQENTVLSCEGQSALGHAVSLVYGPIYGPEGSLLERVRSFRAQSSSNEFQTGGTVTHPLSPSLEGGGTIQLFETPHLVRQVAPIRDVRCYFDLRRLIRAWKPDVVHTHSSKAGILGRAAAWREHVPCVVHTIHGLPFHPYQSRLVNALYIAAERFAAKRCHRIICVADAMREQALAAGIGRAGQYTTVYSGIETGQFLQPRWSRQEVRRELGLNENDFVIGTVSRLAELKGHDDLLDALGELIRQRPGLKLLWVGDGWWRPALMRRVDELQLQGHVITTGLVGPEEVPRYLLAMDALAHPSYREGLPRAVVQALLCGLPVMAYDVDGTKEVCIDGQTGRLIRPGDRTALQEAARWMMDHPDEARRLGQRGRELCRDRFAAATMVKRLEEVYEEVLAQRGA